MKKAIKKSNTSKEIFFSKIFLMICIPILILTFFKVYNNSFDKKISLAGDNAGYYILGKSIASGQGYVNIFTKEMKPHNHFPVGYPLIIASTVKLFSNKTDIIKKANGFFFLLSIGFLFLIVYKITDNYYVPFITCLFTLLNYHLLSYSVIMMSEIPFLFFTTLCLWLSIKINFSLPIKKNWLFFILLILISFTYHIRSTGLALFAGIVLFLLVNKHWKYLLSFILGFILLGLPWYLRTKSLGGNSYMNQLVQKNPYRRELGQMELGDWFKRIWDNFERYITREIPSGTFNFIEAHSPNDPIVLNEWFIGIAIILVMGFGLIKIKKHCYLILFYIIATFGILLLWPTQWFGVRFVLPLIPLLSFLFIVGVVELLTWVGQKVFNIKNQSLIHITIVVFSLLFIKSYGEKPLNKLKQQAKESYKNNFKNYFELATWVKKNTPDSSITVCRKGQLFYLYSKKYVTSYKSTLDKEEQIEHLQNVNADYVVLDQLGYSSTGRYLYPAIKRYPKKFKIIKHLKNPDTYLMKFLPEFGYWGEFKDDKKEGKGTYVWENGQKFEGIWKDNFRNGKGILYYPTGQYLEGIWINDVLEGEVALKSKDDQLIEKSFYKKNVKVKIYGGGK
ncbi:MAG: hypothetical protein GY834_10160 [Bacteroidetes bacterium]|nr:hypothetical protein [Bacteroidota bacterium]